jgi:CDP-diacylglycerol pyrophosphatase
MSDKFLWARGNSQCLTVYHKLDMTALKMAKAQDRLCIHITCNSEGIARLDKEERQLFQHLPVCILLKAQE